MLPVPRWAGRRVNNSVAQWGFQYFSVVYNYRPKLWKVNVESL